MKILLTGANGFIGRNYLDQSNEKSIHVISRRPLEHPSISSNYIGDIADLTFLKMVIKNKFDVIIHCAWQGLPDRNLANNRINLELNRNFIELLSSQSDTKNIFIGSCLEYGDLTGVVNEKEEGINITDFGKTKLDIYRYILDQNLKFIWLRPFYLYGKYQHPNALINYLYDMISTGQDIELQNPNKAHDFLYIMDLIRMIKLIENSNVENEIFNVGSGMSVSVIEIANVVKSLIHKDTQINSVPDHSAIADIKKAQEFMKWSPKYSIETGIREVLKEKIHD